MKNKWAMAQEAECNFWLEKKGKIVDPHYREEIRLRSLRVENWLRKISADVSFDRVLEIGGGATQLIDYFQSKEKHALDPLSDFFQRVFVSVLNPLVSWQKGKSEELPYSDGYFDAVVICNVIDHTDNPSKTLKEIYRVLKKGGLVYISVNAYSGLVLAYKFVHREIEHPHVYSHQGLKQLCIDNGFTVVDEKLDDDGQLKRFEEVVCSNRIKALVHDVCLKMNFYHYSEFIIRK
jgi:SAM-dependent methyltransferase